MKLFCRVVLAGAAAAALALADPMLTLLPSADISGSPGSTVGWGYTITNDTSDWLETTALSSPSFSFGTPMAIFDYPVVAPDSSVTENFSNNVTAQCSAPPCGIYEVTLPSTVPSTPVITGSFDVFTELFSTNPLTDPNTVDLGPGPTVSSDFSVTEMPGSAVPEPAGYLPLLAAALLALAVFKRIGLRRRSRLA